MKPILILYHKNCRDGFGGAYAAWKKFGDKADYIGIDPQGKPKENILKNRKEIYAIDICFSPLVLKKIMKINSNITIIDHHITAENDIKAAKNYFFNLNHSGAILAWRYFHSEKPLPRLLRHIEDIDLWKWKFPFSAEILIALDLGGDFDFKKWDKFAREIEDTKKRKKHIEAGKIALKYKNFLIKRLVGNDKLEEVMFENHKAFAANSPIFQSEIGDFIVKNKKALAIIWSRKNKKINVSLRADNKIDAAKIAEKYGGGGHKKAAGFALKTKIKFPWKVY